MRRTGSFDEVRVSLDALAAEMASLSERLITLRALLGPTRASYRRKETGPCS